MEMKRILGLLTVFCAVSFAGCDKDNYEAPGRLFTGRVVYEEEVVGLRQTGKGQDYNVLELYQPGFPGSAAIPVYVTQDGTFQALLYDGTYRLVAKKGAGPWVDDSREINFDVRGNTHVDFPVTPYYVIRDVRFNVGLDNKLDVSFRVDRGAFTLIDGQPGKLIESVALYLNNTKFVDDATYRKRVDAALAGTGSYTISVSLNDSDLRSYPVLYARIGVGTSGITPKIYSPGSERVK